MNYSWKKVFQRWDDERRRVTGSGEPRLMLIADAGGFHVRRVKAVEYDLDCNEKVYYADKPLGSCKNVQDIAYMLERAMNKFVKGGATDKK